MKFPAIIRHWKAESKIYGKSKNYPFYRLKHSGAAEPCLRTSNELGTLAT